MVYMKFCAPLESHIKQLTSFRHCLQRAALYYSNFLFTTTNNNAVCHSILIEEVKNVCVLIIYPGKKSKIRVTLMTSKKLGCVRSYLTVL